jgi:type IV pilus assembly protein PilE
MRNSLRDKGFTLIELVVAIAIIAILAAIAYPMYTKYLIRGRRASAQAYLMSVAQQEQRYLLDTRSYADATTLNLTPPSDVSTYYQISIVPTSGPPPTFTATATPIATGPQASDGALSINDAGVKTSTNGSW